MKKILIFIVLGLLLITIPASASIGSKGLILEHGKEILVIEKGKKEYLNVQDGLTKIFLFKGVSYYSDNIIVASVGLHSGILRANNIGTATITAINKAGDAGQIKIKVISPKKNHFIPFLLILSLLGIILWFLVKK